MKQYRFYKKICPIEGMYTWWIDIPKFPFDDQWLQMVAGADILLDEISNGKNEVILEISSSPISWDYKLTRVKRLGLLKGALYESFPEIKSPSFDNKNILWLCPATLWVFWRYPKGIWFKIKKSQ